MNNNWVKISLQKYTHFPMYPKWLSAVEWFGHREDIEVPIQLIELQHRVFSVFQWSSWPFFQHQDDCQAMLTPILWQPLLSMFQCIAFYWHRCAYIVSKCIYFYRIYKKSISIHYLQTILTHTVFSNPLVKQARCLTFFFSEFKNIK